MTILWRTLKTRIGRQLFLLGLTAGWRFAKSPEGRKVLHAAFNWARRRRSTKTRGGHVTVAARRVVHRVRA